MVSKPKIVVVVGPTASGKSDLAVGLARAWGGEIISADSRQVYRGMNIGTGKVTKPEMRGIPHHLLDVASPNTSYTVAHFKDDAEKALAKILKKGKLPIVCGGTGFYISALVDDFTLPDVPPNKALRRHLEKKSAHQLFALLKRIDPRRAKQVDAKNPYRLIRAIEIAQALGKVPVVKKRRPYDTLFIGILLPKELLRARIHKRLKKRMSMGMLKEVKTLHQNGVSWKRMEELGLEYRFCTRYLRDIIDKKTMLAELETAINQYAKRQMTWFKKEKNICWIRPDIKEADRLVQKFLNTPARKPS